MRAAITSEVLVRQGHASMQGWRGPGKIPSAGTRDPPEGKQQAKEEARAPRRRDAQGQKQRGSQDRQGSEGRQEEEGQGRGREEAARERAEGGGSERGRGRVKRKGGGGGKTSALLGTSPKSGLQPHVGFVNVATKPSHYS